MSYFPALSYVSISLCLSRIRESLRRRSLVVDGQAKVIRVVPLAVRRHHTETVVAVATGNNWSGQGRDDASLADEVGGVVSG
jgi:hypothetical protein